MKRYLIFILLFSMYFCKSQSAYSQNVLIVSGSNSFSVNSQVLPLGALVLNVFRDSLHVELDFVSCSVTIPPYYYTPVFISNRDLTKYYLNGVQCTDVADFRTFYNTYMVSTGGGGGGGVSSVGLTAPSSVFSVSGTPITTSGTFGLVFKGGLASNKVLSTPDGTTGAVGLRTLVINDIPFVTSFTTPTNTTVPTSSAVNGLVSNYALKTTSLTINGITQTFTSTPNYSVGTMTGTSISTANGFAGSSDGNVATPIITMSTTVTSGSILKSSTGSIIAATPNTDYLPPNNAILTGTMTVNAVSVFSSVATFNSTINKLTLTAPANGSTITIIDGKTFTCANTIKFTATDGQSYALPTTSATIARTDAGQTFTGTQTFSSASNYSWANATETSLAVSTAGVVSQASWVDFSGTAAITSYSVITTSSYQYQKIGKEVKLHVIVQGQRTNSAGTITFTLPFAASTATRAHYYALWGTSTSSANQLYRLTIPGDGTTTATIQAASTTSAVINFLASNLQDIDINISYWTD